DQLRKRWHGTHGQKGDQYPGLLAAEGGQPDRFGRKGKRQREAPHLGACGAEGNKEGQQGDGGNQGRAQRVALEELPAKEVRLDAVTLAGPGRDLVVEAKPGQDCGGEGGGGETQAKAVDAIGVAQVTDDQPAKNSDPNRDVQPGQVQWVHVNSSR